MALKEKKERFCLEYILDFNGAAAARRCGYSARRSHITASNLLAEPDVQARLKELITEQQKRLEKTADDVVKELMAVAFTNATDFVNIADQEVKRGRRTSKVRVVQFETTGDLPEEKKKAISEIRQNQQGVAIKLHDKVKALQLLGMHFGIFEKDNRQRTPPVDFEDVPIKFK